MKTSKKKFNICKKIKKDNTKSTVNKNSNNMKKIDIKRYNTEKNENIDNKKRNKNNKRNKNENK